MAQMAQYWIDRYGVQGEKTVGHVSFTDEQYVVKTEAAIKLLLKCLSFNNISAKKVLDFGCGHGRMTRALIPMFLDVYGIDIVPWAIQEAKKNCTRGKFMVFDGEEIPFLDGYFNLVLCWTVLQHIPPTEIGKICSEIARVLAKDGKLVLYENVSVWHPNKVHIWFRTPGRYSDLFDNKFEVLDYEIIKGADDNDERHFLTVLRK